jgi:hypothetical protein
MLECGGKNRIPFWAILLLTHHSKIPVFHYSKKDDMAASARRGAALPGGW